MRGYKEEGTTTTPFDMVVRNDMDRFHLVADVVDRVPKLSHVAAYVKQSVRDRLIDHSEYITQFGLGQISELGSPLGGSPGADYGIGQCFGRLK